MPGKRLSFEERRFIEWGRRERLSLREIGAALGRPHTTISREIERNRQARNGAYRCVVAEHWTRQRAKRPKSFKLETHRWLAVQVARKLKRGWSPQQIAQQLRRDHPDDPRWWVSTEAIYHSLYVQGRGGLRAELSAHLKSRRTQRASQQRQGKIVDRVHFSQRPAEAADRAVPGHWEGDLIIGAGGHSQVGMLTERSTRYTMLFALPHGRSAPDVRSALVRLIRRLPAHLRRSLTWDNGLEMAEHAQLRIAASIDVFFCDPGHPWQRGTAENTIGLVRAYLPKGSDLSSHSQRRLDTIAVMLNERPRKTLNWQSPAEAYAHHLAVQ